MNKWLPPRRVESTTVTSRNEANKLKKGNKWQYIISPLKKAVESYFRKTPSESLPEQKKLSGYRIAELNDPPENAIVTQKSQLSEPSQQTPLSTSKNPDRSVVEDVSNTDDQPVALPRHKKLTRLKAQENGLIASKKESQDTSDHMPVPPPRTKKRSGRQSPANSKLPSREEKTDFPVYATVNKKTQLEKVNRPDAGEKAVNDKGNVLSESPFIEPTYSSLDDFAELPATHQQPAKTDTSDYSEIDNDDGYASIPGTGISEQDGYSYLPDDLEEMVLEDDERSGYSRVKDSPIKASVRAWQEDENTDPAYASIGDDIPDPAYASIGDDIPDTTYEDEGIYERLPGDDDVPDSRSEEIQPRGRPYRSLSLDTGMDQYKSDIIDEDPYETLDLPPELPPRPLHLQRSASTGDIDSKGIKQKKHINMPLKGIRNWAKGAKDKYADINGLNDGATISQRVQTLMSRCSKPGDAIVLTFRGSRHSGMLVYDDIEQKPVYLSFGNESSYNKRGGGEQELWHDIYGFQDMLTENHIVPLIGMDNQAILKQWRESIKNKSFNVLTRNCSAIIKKLLITGSEQPLGKTRFKNDKTWQMPYNTLELAREIRDRLPKK